MKDIPPGKLLNRALLSPEFGIFSRPWVNRAKSAAKREDWFSALIYLWVTFNAWLAMIVSDRRFSERDSYLWQACGIDPQFCWSFDDLIETNKDFRELVNQFRNLWPVFKVRALVDQEIDPWGAWGDDESRTEFRSRSFSTGLSESDYAPRCYLDHQEKDPAGPDSDPKKVPLDWGHTLGAIYQVRCNLFHGGKSFLSSSDQVFVQMAYEILDHVWRETGMA